jgi:O-acetyl-ADP-ribose deacetylase (regulator of RNase III)
MSFRDVLARNKCAVLSITFMILALWDTNPELVVVWTQLLGHLAGLQFGCGNLLNTRVDAVVSPANSYGYMDGGIDLAFRSFFGLGIQFRVQTQIKQKYGGELPIGEAFLVHTGHPRIRRMVVAPTMKTPQNISDTSNVYLACKAALQVALLADPPIEKLGMPGLGTGIGRMPIEDCARQMKQAIEEVLNPKHVF